MVIASILCCLLSRWDLSLYLNLNFQNTPFNIIVEKGGSKRSFCPITINWPNSRQFISSHSFKRFDEISQLLTHNLLHLFIPIWSPIDLIFQRCKTFFRFTVGYVRGWFKDAQLVHSGSWRRMLSRCTTGSQWVVREDVFQIHNWFTVGREGGCF